VPDLTFLHLSDIHFKVFDGDEDHDLESRVREQMVLDIQRVHEVVGNMDAILVLGDVAHSGQQDQYELASEFLDRVAGLIGCAADRVICVPGNHDINRPSHDPVHGAVRWYFRRLPANQVSDALRRMLNTYAGAELLLGPLEAYNTFALRYGCDIAHGRLTWEPKEFSLGDRDVIVYGVNSSWVCDATDSDKQDETQVVLGAFQCGQVRSQPESVALTLVHHPGNWLRDAVQTEPWLALSHVILTGHEHASGITPDATRRNVTIASGAVNPDRTESGWIPAYNVIRLHLDEGSEEVEVEIHVRCWQNDRAEFGPDPLVEDPYRVSIRLGDRPVGESKEPAHPPPTATPEPIGSGHRAMIYNIMRAAPDTRLAAAHELGLVIHSDLRGLELDRHILERAVAEGLAEQLEERIRGRRADG
jgi:calcineurin-like phosphoesterase family protein